MSVLNLFKKVKAQIDPFDNGATYSSPAARPRPQPVPVPAQRGPLPLYSRDQTSQRLMGAPRNDSEQGMRAMGMPIWAPTADPNQQSIGYKPMDDATRSAVNRAAEEFQWTPKFREIVAKAQPQITNQINSDELNNIKAARGTYDSSSVGKSGFRPYNQYINEQQIKIDPKYASPNVITHEGLHAADSKGGYGNRRDFIKAYNQSTTPAIQDYLSKRTEGYKSNQSPQSFSKFSQLNPSMRTELHSYLSEIPMSTGQNLPKGLQDYYRRYLDTSLDQKLNRYKMGRSINDALTGYRYRVPQPGED